ncbi:MAG: biotin--[acetyl-CoA-carboxylase] ligase [Thermoguttaceae bacterium]|jgi:BirA family biotin operon repressor/biotin-[acetyl-CoA-carboxylase] ligase
MDINRILRETFIVEVEHREELGSTNDRAAERAKQGANRLPLLVIADRQTAGRGRGGNRWWTGSDSLAFSLLLESPAVEGKKDENMLGRQFNCPPNVLVQSNSRPNVLVQSNRRSNILVGLGAGVAVVESLKPLLGNVEIGILWPNDVMAAGRKLAGILVEVLTDGRAVIGIGINTNNSMSDVPAELLRIATTLLELSGKLQDHTEILIAFLNRMEEHIITLKQAPAELAARADALCLQRDKPIALQHGRKTIAGLCRGIAPDGALLLETSDGIRSFYSGTIIR